MRCIAALAWPLGWLFIGGACAVSAEFNQPMPEKADAFLPNIQRMLFLGDSVTYDGRYVAYFETQWRLHLPNRPMDIINCGLPSETVSGLSEEGHAGGKFPRPTVHERLARVLKHTRPQLVFACYGMNDGIYLPFDKGRFQKFKDGMLKLHKDTEAAGARIIHLTPPVFDALPIRKRVAPADQVSADRPFEGYDEVLNRYSQWLLAMRDQGWTVIDLHGPMKAALTQARKENPKFTFAPDGVHPDEAGQRFLGQTLAEGLKAPFAASPLIFGDRHDPTLARGKTYRLVHERQRILTDAWLTHTRHNRPMPKGLPLDQAKAKAAELEKQLRELMR